MTELLCYELPLVCECTAKVLSCAEKDGRFHIVLDRTPLFPEGGGQLPDGGSISARGVSADIVDCRTSNGVVTHICTAPFGDGETVTVRLDDEKRMDHSEQHTGEHILSGLAAKLFGAVNVGFHMAESYCTIDLVPELTPAQLVELELAANAAVRADSPVHTEVTDEADAMSRTLRKRAEKAQGEVRIVYIDNGKVDSCTCCGTHLPRTGMVGAIRITDSQRYKAGTRLWFACGGRAAKLGIDERAELTALARQYSTSREELPNAIKKQMDELASVKAELKAKSELLAKRNAASLMKNAARAGETLVVCEVMHNLNANDIKLICDIFARDSEEAEAVLSKERNSPVSLPFALLLFAPSAAGTDYRMACSKGFPLSMKELCAAVNAAVNGKGGGSPLFAQGKTERKVDDETAAMLREYMLRAAGADK